MTDAAGVLTPEERRSLEARLADFERDTTHQIAVLTLPTLEGEPIETFGIRLAEAWKIGQAGRDNGAILIVARDDRELRIEVGYGLEGVIPDVVAKRIIEDVIVPEFRGGALAAGISRGVDALMKAARGEQLPVSEPRDRPGAGSSTLHAILFAAVLGSFLGRAFGARGGVRWLGSGASGLAAAGLAYLMLGALGAALAAALLGALLGGGAGFSLPYLASGGLGRSGGFGGGFGGGGFGGGGGGFGGGGASGRW